MEQARASCRASDTGRAFMSEGLREMTILEQNVLRDYAERAAKIKHASRWRNPDVLVCVGLVVILIALAVVS